MRKKMWHCKSCGRVSDSSNTVCPDCGLDLGFYGEIQFVETGEPESPSPSGFKAQEQAESAAEEESKPKTQNEHMVKERKPKIEGKRGKVLILTGVVVLVLGCIMFMNMRRLEMHNSGSADDNSEESSDVAEDNSEVADVKSEGVMTYAEYVAAAIDDEVVIEAYVQAKQSWWDNKATVYAQDKDGAYFLYDMACSEEDYTKLTPGTKIKVTGYKSEWSGEIEIMDGTFEIMDGNYVATAEDVTSLLGTDNLINKQNMFVAFKGMTVEAKKDADGNDVAFLYKWDGSGQDGDDLYFDVSLNGQTYTFTVESYLCDNTTAVYSAVKNLNVGDVIDMEGFLYWYEGVNPHITSVTAAK